VLTAAIAFAAIEGLEAISRAYTEVVGSRIPNLASLEKVVSESEKPVAVMFEAETCPICRKIFPYWARLEEASDELPVAFYHITYSAESAPAFIKYGVTETPTFIVFVDGKPVARYVGGFEADNITEAILAWVLAAAGLAEVSDPHKLAREGLSIFNTKCSTCHGLIEGLEITQLRSWLNTRRLVVGDLLAERIVEALSKNTTLSELYGGYGALSDAVASMRAYVPDLTSYEVDRLAYFLDYISSRLAGREPPQIPLTQYVAVNATSGMYTPLTAGAEVGAATYGTVLGLVAALVAGLAVALSPCTLPVFLAYLTALRSSVSSLRCTLCGVSVFASVLAMGLLFTLLGVIASQLQEVLVPVLGSVVVAIGLATILGVPVELPMLLGRRPLGLVGFCALYGVVAIQCSLPLVAGALLLAASSAATIPLLVATAFALGASVPLSLAVYLVPRFGRSVAERINVNSFLLYRLSGIVLVAIGLTITMYSLGAI
jgi:cytochrome c biogenesis protein CcdA/thiol-disulfide isomerase/thioredoxin